ncbi:MAG: terpene cyclase/mutase family protein [Lentisphaeraceae bacterium]|nr:terpene cyclase/mutase family protein [Lentisphaeraceae bacterium]
MSLDVIDDEYYDEDLVDDNSLSEEDILEIRNQYYKQRLKESLVGPVISTLFHVVLIIVLAIMITDKYQPQKAEIVVTMETIEEVKIEEPPPIEEPVPEEVENTDTVNPVLTTVAIENVDTNDAALEDTNDEAPSTDDDSAVEAVSDVTVSPSAFASPNVFGGRSAAGRASSVSKFGGSKVGQDSLLKALWWLAKVQNPNGSWGTSENQAFTGLALLTFLAHGETPTSKNFGTNIKKAMLWLAEDKISKAHGKGYGHAIKAYALSEAYAMTGISMLEDAMNRSIKLIIKGQQETGAFDYRYRLEHKTRQDLSLSGWNFQALKAAYGAGCEAEGLDGAIYKSVDWLKKAAAFESGFPYTVVNNSPNKRKSHTMRAVGSLCLQLFGEGDFAELQDDINIIAEKDLTNLNWNNPPKESLYGWYYATQVMFQAGGKKWKSWNRKFQKELTSNQHKEGYWEYPGEYHDKGLDALTSKIYATTLCALQLTVYYRYLPSTKGALGAKKDANKPVEEEELDLID